jgi:hypothetical protein
VDATLPGRSVNLLSAVTNTPRFAVSRLGSDNPGGSCLQSFDGFGSAAGGAFQPRLTGTTHTLAPYTGSFGHTYAFHNVATDNLGNREATPAAAAAGTDVKSVPHPVGVALRPKRSVKHWSLVAEVGFGGGLAARDMVTPFQQPSFQGLRAVLQDLDGDGTFDSLLFTAQKGKRKVSRTISF